MNTSEPSKSPSHKRKAELQRLFWAARVMQGFRDGRGNMFNIPERWDNKRLADFLFADFDPATYPTDTHPSVVYVFDGTTCADQLWLFVTAEGMLIVPPFHLAGDRADIPLFPEERSCSASR